MLTPGVSTLTAEGSSGLSLKKRNPTGFAQVGFNKK